MIAIIVTILIITIITIVKIIMIQNTKTAIPAKKIIKVLLMLIDIKVVIEVMFYAVFYLFNRLPHK